MNSVIRNVADLSADERHVYENVLGRALQDNQKIIIQLVTANRSGIDASDLCQAEVEVLEPYAMWAEFSDDEIAELEAEILDRSASRPA